MKILVLSHFDGLAIAAIGAPVSVLLAMASYSLIELPFLQLKHRGQLFAMFKIVPSEPKM
jgi:peptidoglycan/LPS O-acetylase OafA/YrhL